MRASFEGKLAALLLGTWLIAAVLAAVIASWLHSALLGMLIALLIGVVPLAWMSRRIAAPLRRMLRALAGAVASYRDGDFSISLVVDRQDELGELITAHNELGAALREQRQQLVQRELLLDTVTQQSPVALLLVDSHERVVYSNLAARHLLNNGTSMNGQDFREVLSRSPKALAESVATGDDNLFTVATANDEETYHLSQRRFMLRGRPHRLLLVKRLTRELSRQEVAIWKKLIRVLSHELNNSLAPISSLANSGAELARRGDLTALPGVFTTISERATHLHEFIAGYATFARLPAPRPEAVSWKSLVDALHAQVQFQVVGDLPERPGYFDRVQVEQVLINLLHNAHESGSELSHIEMAVASHDLQRIEVRDRGSGMSESVLAQALLPFYSTKRSGSGLGLALAREIAEAHGGHIRLANREDGGVVVSVLLPQFPGDLWQ